MSVFRKLASFFYPRSRERNDEYKFDYEYFPAKVSPLLRGSNGTGEEGAFTSIRLYQKSLRTILAVNRTLNKIHLFIIKKT